MSDTDTITYFCPEEDATTMLAQALATSLTAPYCVLLEGDVGAGKSHISRTIIRTWAEADIDVPSPTFTLVQNYDTSRGEIWHVDLYRLGDSQDLIELGLLDAMEYSLCLIEWPDLIQDLALPPVAHIQITPHSDGRAITIAAPQTLITQIVDMIPANGSLSKL